VFTVATEDSVVNVVFVQQEDRWLVNKVVGFSDPFADEAEEE
jgi:hypothetical protein